MKRFLLVAFLALPAAAQSPLTFADLAGWWSAAPEHGGESTPVAMQFVEMDGRPEAHLSVPAIGGYDINLGTVEISGNAIDTKGLSFPLTWNPETGTLSGRLPAEAAPVYDIPIEFRRGEPMPVPPAKEWRARRPKFRWTTDLGAPVWAGLEREPETGTLYIGDEQGSLHALDPEGQVRWTFATGKAIRAQPRVVGRHVYVHSDAGYLFKLERDSGREVWRARIDAGSEPRLPTDQPETRWDRYGSSVVTDGKRLFVASRDKHLYALDAKTGRERWRVEAGDIMTATPVLHGGNVIFAAYDGQVRAVSASDGKPRWTYDAKLAVAGDLTIADGRVLAGSRTYDLIALDAKTGRELWKRYYWFSWIESPPVVRDGVVYTGSSDATNIYAVDLADGAFRWKTPVPGYSWQRVAVDDDLVIAGTSGAGAYPGRRAGSLLALDRASGGIRWMILDPPDEATAKARTPWGFGASPVIADDLVYAADLAGRVYAIELRQ